MNKHENIRQFISLYFDGEASAQEKETVEAHIKECASCQKYYQDLSKLSSSLQSWNNETLSPDLEQKINQDFLKLKQEEQKMKNKTPLFKASVGGGVVVTILLLVLSMQVYNKQVSSEKFKNVSNSSVMQTAQVNTDGQIQKYEPYYLKTDSKKDKQMSKTPQVGHAAKANISNEAMFERKHRIASMPVRSRKERYQVKKISRRQMDKGRSLNVASASSTAVEMADMSSIAQGIMGGPQRRGFSEREEVSDSFREYIMPVPPPQPTEDYNREQYDRIYENKFLAVKDSPLSTFSIDVDTASYSNVRRFLNRNQMPPEDAVRIEEMVNYFTYNYPKPTDGKPFSITTKASICPWNPQHKLALIALQGKTLKEDEIPESNLVFLIDVSGSMNQPNKLPLLKKAYKMMVNQLTDKQRVAIVVYAGAAGKVLESTPGNNKYKILQAIDRLSAGGSTAGGAGIHLAYNIAKENFIKGGNNRVILATDGDFNIGASSNAEMIRLIEKKRDEGIFLTVLGFGMGNYQDSRLEQIANKGNGNYYYIDTNKEAKKVLVSELGSTLFTIAKDVKIQVEFNPAQVKAYRLIGYENRLLAKEDFNDDTKDAGELGAGHSVTALYEIVTVDSSEEFGDVDDLVYQQKKVISSDDLMTVKLRYKEPDGNKSKLIKKVIKNNEITEALQGNFQFAASVAEFGLVLRNSKFKNNASYDNVINNAEHSIGKDSFGYRKEFIDLVKKAQSIDNRPQRQGIIFKGE